jgi:hypothetical protein
LALQLPPFDCSNFGRLAQGSAVQWLLCSAVADVGGILSGRYDKTS